MHLLFVCLDVKMQVSLNCPIQNLCVLHFFLMIICYACNRQRVKKSGVFNLIMLSLKKKQWSSVCGIIFLFLTYLIDLCINNGVGGVDDSHSWLTCVLFVCLTDIWLHMICYLTVLFGVSFTHCFCCWGLSFLLSLLNTIGKSFLVWWSFVMSICSFIDILQEAPLSGHRQPRSILGGALYCLLLASILSVSM